MVSALLFTSAAALAQKNRSADCNLGAYYLSRGDYAKALTAVKGIRGSGDSAAAELNVKGLAELTNGRLDSALATFDKALAADPAMIEPRFNRAITLLKLKRYTEAVRELGVVAQKDPDFAPEAAFHQAIAYQGAGDLASAAASAAKAFELDPSFDAALFYSGVIAERQGRFQDAGEAYKNYMQRVPASPTPVVRFAVVAQRAGHTDTARKYFERVLQQWPDSAEAVEARKYLIMWE